MKLTHRNNTVTPVRRNSLQSGIKDSGRTRATLVKGESMSRVYDHGNTGKLGCQPSYKATFGRVGMNNSVVLTPQEVG